jgi:energy-coupling factor transporter ATP-binding protein EcfA2
MTNNNLNPFVGLKPYTKKTSTFYFGREQEVENLLGVLQKNKFVTLSGATGAGKTSLINAGLIPRLKKGFVGQAGKDWAIASFRPGIEPLLNLSQALTASDVLKEDVKSSTTDRKYYSEIISNFGSLGIAEIYKRSEIFGKKNLLIIIDQLEDLYKYNRYFNYTASNEDNTLMDLVYRTVTIKNTAIYFLICIETSYLTKFTFYNKLQEIISKSQYSIQNIDHSGIHQILENTFYKKNIHFDPIVLNLIIDTLKKEISYLPNLQFLLYKLYKKFIINGDEKSIISLADVEALGGIKQSIAKDFENLYESSSEIEQYSMANFFKAILDTQNLSSKVQYETISKISEHINISQSALSSKIRLFKKTFNELFDVFEPSISGIPIAENKSFDSKNILSLKYTEFLNWERHFEWKKEEERDFEYFKSLSEDAIKKNKGEISYLKTPELESAIAWKEKEYHNKSWAKKYNLDFDKTINYINESEQDDIKIKKQKSDQLARERKKDRRAKRGAIIFSLVCSFVLVIGWFFYKKAEVEKIKAKEATKDALIQKASADLARQDAIEATKEALIQKDSADLARQVAINAKDFALIQKDNADKAKTSALEAKAAAVAAFKSAKKSDSIAKEESKLAKKESEKNKTLKELIELESDFKDLTISLSSAKQEKNFEKIKKLINLSILKQKRFNALKQHELIEAEEISGDESILELNQKILTVIEEKNFYGQTEMLLTKNTSNYSIRSFDILNNQKIAYAGDNGEINFYNIINEEPELEGIKIMKYNNQIEDRLRNLIYDNKNTLIATTFSGKVLKVDPEDDPAQVPVNIYETVPEDGAIIDFFIDSMNNKQYLITAKKIKIFDNYNLEKENTDYKNIKATYYLDSKLFVISENVVFVLDGKGNNYEVSLGIEAADMKLVDRIYVTNSYLFLGTKNGNIFWYDYNYEDVKNSKTKMQKDKFENHSSGITSILLEEDKNFLFTASLDNKIFRYDLNYAPNLIRNSKTNLVGHNKWIWDMSTYTNKNDKKLLITADEDGNLLTWYIDPKDFLENIESRFETFLNK